jgi:citrate synthase
MARADSALWTEGAWLMRVLAAALAGGRGLEMPFHEQLARRWKLNRQQADWIRRALVACADHELNASTFTVRVIASTGASLASCLIGGLEALSGPRHGSATLRLKAWMERMRGQRRLRQAIREQLDRGEMVPGFGHPLYPEGDPRAQVILSNLSPDRKRNELIAVVHDLTGLKPNIDFGLTALTEAMNRPAQDALTLFALGRSAGWIAHAIEQNETGTLIRPRATFRTLAPDGRG